MPSIIEGYNCDIFISYRQKDNKHDGWVTEFVDNLKGELEATFKEDISVYFDINPHDGLLETHDVDESLKEKLKCLVFIPIISRTYCDPKSFAWEHEFKVFVEQASNDQFGLKVKLPNSNVTSRVLPVQIHDLDKEDITQCESVLGSVLRGIEFIYKEAGVDKPLAPDDDVKKNLNNTKYKIQIVKVTHAIKDIITAIQNYSPQQDEIIQEVSKPVNTSQKSKKTPIILTSVVAIALIILGVLFIPKLFNPSEVLEKSIAVLPFHNDSPNEERMYFINGTMEAILDNLCKIKDLRVPGRTSVEQYRDNPPSIPTIAKELDVNYILEGSGHRDGNNVRLFVQLLDGKKDKHLWSKTYDADIEKIFSMYSEIAKLVAAEIEAIITPEEQDLIEKIPTTNLTAFDFYQRGREEHRKYNFGIQNKEVLERAETLYKYAIENDSTFAKAYVGLASVYWSKHYWEDYYSENFLDSVLILANIALSIDKQLAEAYVARGRYYMQFNKRAQAFEEFNKAIEINPNDWTANHALGNWHQEVDLVKAIIYYHKSASLNRGPELPSILRSLSEAYLNAGFVENAKYYNREILRLDGDSVAYYLHLSKTEFILGHIVESIDLLERGFAIDSTNIDILSSLVFQHLLSGRYEESLEYYKENLNKLYNVSESRVMRYGFRGGFIFLKNGLKEEAIHYLNASIEILTKEKELTINEPGAAVYYDLAAAYAFKGEHQKAYENLRMFNQKPLMYSNDVILFKTEPLFDNIREEPEFQQIAKDIEAKYQAEHERVLQWLEENDML